MSGGRKPFSYGAITTKKSFDSDPNAITRPSPALGGRLRRTRRHYRRAARWDGTPSIGVALDEMMTLAEIVKLYPANSIDHSFDIAQWNAATHARTQAEKAGGDRCATTLDVGLTWWLEGLNNGLRGSVQEARRIMGPPKKKWWHLGEQC